MRAYKSLSGVEHAFRSLKTVDLELRPVSHWTAPRVRAHVLLCMLAYYYNAARLHGLSPNPGFTHWSLGVCQLLLGHVAEASDLLRKARTENPRIYFFHLYLAGALGFDDDLDEAKIALADALRLKPEVGSMAQWRAYQPWITNPRQWELRERTVNVGLRRAGFPDE